MEWTTDLDIALRSVPWMPLHCSSDGAEERVLLAKYLSSNTNTADSSPSCCLLLFDCESGQSFFEPLRASRILKRCTHLVEDASSSLAATSGTSQDDTDARLTLILSALGHVFDIASSARSHTTFAVQATRYTTTLDIRTKENPASAGLELSFSFEADTLDHEPASSVFLNHWALPLLGVGSTMQRLLLSGHSSGGLLPDLQHAVDASAQGAQQDHCKPILDFFNSPLLSTSLTRWSETHLRREQPRAILASFVSEQSTDRIQPASPQPPTIESQAPSSPVRPTSPARLIEDHDSQLLVHPTSPESSSASTSNKRPSPLADSEETSPSKRHRPADVAVGSVPAITAARESPMHQQSEADPDDEATDSEATVSDWDDEEFNPSPRLNQQGSGAPDVAPPPAAQTTPSPPADYAMPDRPGIAATAAITSTPMTEPASTADDDSTSAGILSSPSKAGPAPVRTVVAPLRKGGAPARGTARNRRF